ncbi:MAG: nitrophenyl compound nitroreductase subunit ArsF family protein [Candidatus Omnitrophica bacterium]|nr:nitrophenyl compound nitroreductase subunit ArsF family protein [Candidatus Omnitrophota bacterium]
MKKILLGVFALSLICLIPSSLFAQSDDKVIVYYFHTTFRCPSCHKIEQYTEGAIKEYFAKEIESGDLEYKVINIEEKGNEHFVQDYKLYTKSVVLTLIEDGKEIRSKNLEQVWQLLRNKDQFYQYIKNETQGFLDSLREDDKL